MPWRRPSRIIARDAVLFRPESFATRRVRQLARMPQTVVHSNRRFVSSMKISLKLSAPIPVLWLRSFPMTHAFCAMDQPLPSAFRPLDAVTGSRPASIL
jgi:hypothetical protein